MIRSGPSHERTGDHPIEHVVVVVPAHNEARTIESTTICILTAIEALPAGITSDLIVVADGCSDHTAELAAGLGATVIETAPRCVGMARRLGTEHALGQIDTEPSRVWLANTDADTLVPSDWLCRQLEHGRCGLRGVTGIVDLAARPGQPELAARFERYYVIAADGTHAHVHGANLGIRADAYLAAGGWRPLHTGEDHDLWNRVVRTGSTRSDTTLRVCTSSRLRGRAPNGFAGDLSRLAAAS